MPFYQETKTAKGAVIGTILPWTGGLTSIPAGWIICDGQTLSASDFPLLAQAVGDTYNAGSSDFDGNFPGYLGSIKMPNLNGKTLMDIESSYFANIAAGGTGRAADLDAKALTVMDPIIGTNEDAGVTTIFTDVFVDLVFNINNDDRTGYEGKIRGNTLIQGEGIKTIYIGPRRLGRKHIKRHNHSGSLETINNNNPAKPGKGVVPYDPIYYTLFAHGIDNDGDFSDQTDDEQGGVDVYFGWTSSDFGWANDSPAADNNTPNQNSNISNTRSGETSDLYGGIVGGRLSSPGGSPTAGITDTYALQWPNDADVPTGFGQGQPGKIVSKAASEQPPINMKPAYATRSPLSRRFLTTPAKSDGKYISDSVPFGIGGNTVGIPEGFKNHYTTSDSVVGDTLVSNPGLNFTSESATDKIFSHTHDEFEVVFDGSRMRPQSNLAASVTMPTATLDNTVNQKALQIDFNIQQPRVTSIYIIRAY
jgi:microcystin-dependent protein